MKRTIDIPVKPHVLKYLEFYLGADYTLSESDPYGLFLFHLMRRPLTDKRKDELVAKYPSRFVMDFGPYSPQQYGLKNLTGKTVYQFNNFVHGIIRQDMLNYVDVATDYDNTVKHAIESFMAKYGFEETDIAYDTLLKAYQRYCEERKASKKKTQALTPRKALKQLEKQLHQVVTRGQQVPVVALQKFSPQSV